MTVTTIVELPISKIHADEEFNCRGPISPMEVMDLAESIREKGLLQPVVVMEYDQAEKERTGYDYLLIAGYRRFTAKVKILRHETIVANVASHMDEADARVINLSENFQRKDLNMLQEAKALHRLFELGWTEDQVAAKIGKGRGWVQIRFMVLKLPKAVQEEVAAGVFAQIQIRDLYSALNKKGEEALYKLVREFKKARERGKTMRKRLAPQKPQGERKYQRKKPEMFRMIDHLIDSIGYGLHTRLLAWCAGEISTVELLHDIKEWDDKYGDGDYVVPTDGELFDE